MSKSLQARATAGILARMRSGFPSPPTGQAGALIGGATFGKSPEMLRQISLPGLMCGLRGGQAYAVGANFSGELLELAGHHSRPAVCLAMSFLCPRRLLSFKECLRPKRAFAYQRMFSSQKGFLRTKERLRPKRALAFQMGILHTKNVCFPQGFLRTKNVSVSKGCFAHQRMFASQNGLL